MALATLSGVRRQLDEQNSTVDDDILAEYLAVASEIVEDYCGNYFAPRKQTKYFSGEVGLWNPILGLEDWPLFEVITLTNGDGSAVSADNYTLLPRGEYPKRDIRIAAGSYWKAPNDTSENCPGYAPLMDEAYAEDAIAVEGVWGFHRNYAANGWGVTGKTLGAGLSDSASQLTLSEAAGLTTSGHLAIDVGDLLRIGSTTTGEYIAVVGPVASTSAQTVLDIERAQNGTSAQTHSVNAPIFIWKPERRVRLAVEMTVAAHYKGRNSASGSSPVVVPGFGRVASLKEQLPSKARDLLGWPFYSYRRGRAE